MNKMPLFAFVVWCLCAPLFPTLSQPHLFKVLQTQGTVEIRHEGRLGWAPIKAGMSFTSLDILRLADKSYTAILCEDLRAIELFRKGVFGSKELQELLEVRRKSPVSRFLEYALEEVTNVTKPLDLERYHDKFMRLSGSVERGLNSTRPRLQVPDSINVMDAVVTIAWRGIEQPRRYRVEIYDTLTLFYTQETEDTSISIDLVGLGLAQSRVYYWKVASHNGFDQASFTLVSNSMRNAIQDTIGMIADFSRIESSLSFLRQAGFYERHRLYYRALSCYREAINRSSAATEFRKAYALFLVRQGLLEDAKSILSYMR